VHFFTKQPVRTPDDLKRTKLFAWAGDTDVIETYKAAGMNPIPLPSTEVSTALQTGLVTAMPAPTQAAVALQWFRHANHMTNIRWTLLVGATVITKKRWQQVPAELRPELIEAAQAAGERLRKETRASSPKDIAAMQKRGLKVIEVDAATQALWEKLVEDAYPRIRGRVIPADAFDEARRLLAEYRSSEASHD
jgi:TRAP-type C4-dicarboxylate transport system substrate-binding protein